MENPIKMDDLGVPLFSETLKSTFANQRLSSDTSRLAASFGLVAYFKPWRSLLSTQVDMITHVTGFFEGKRFGTLKKALEMYTNIYHLYMGYIMVI